MRDPREGFRRPAGPRATAVVLVLLLAVSMFGSACATVPSSGPVYEGDPVAAEDSGISPVRPLPPPPLDGEGPVDIVRGFLEASASFEGGHQVARLHLDPAVASRWNPAAGVVVYDPTDPNEPLVESAAESENSRIVALDARRVATIDEQGSYSPARPNASLRAEFRLRKVAGEWRISDLQDRLLLTRADLSSSFRPVNLSFLDPDREIVVPDRVYLPLRGPRLATVMVQALLHGPTDWLGPAVRTAFPPGTRLASTQVDVDRQGIATVNLTSHARVAGGRGRQDMAAQLVWTLRQLPEISGVRVTVDGAALEIPGASFVQSRSAWHSHDPSALPDRATGYLLRRNRLFALEGGGLVPAQEQPTERASPLRSPAVSLDGRRLAALSPSADALRVGSLGPGEPLATLLRGQDFTTPTWDRLGNVWTAGRPQGSRTQVWVVGRSGTPRRVEIALGDADVLALRVARDGTRVALVTTSGGVDHLLVGRVVRGASLRVDALHDITGLLTEVRDVAWAEPDRLAVLGRGLQRQMQVWAVDVDGSGITSRGSVPGAVMLSVAAAPATVGARPLLVGTDHGVVYQNAAGTSWQRVSDGQDPTYPG